MGRQTVDLIKDLIISILIIACIILVLAIFFYDKIAISKMVPEAEEYVLSEQMQQELENTSLDNAQEIIVNYYIDGKDLNKYEKTNEYNKGKGAPFSNISTPVTGNNSSSNTNNGNISQNFYEDGGIK